MSVQLTESDGDDLVTSTVLTIALLLLLSLGYGGWRRWRARRRRARQAVLAAARDDLESEHLQARLMAISSLEAVARENAEAYWQVAQTLCGFARKRGRRATEAETSPAQTGIPALPPDLQMALTVIAQSRPDDPADQRSLDLSGSHLSRAGLPGARLPGVNLTDCRLLEAELWKADLENANLARARLDGANMSGALLDGACLCHASLEGANLEYASLRGADLSDADLRDANLALAHLERACLAHATGLTRQQLESAFRDRETELPDTVA